MAVVMYSSQALWQAAVTGAGGAFTNTSALGVDGTIQSGYALADGCSLLTAFTTRVATVRTAGWLTWPLPYAGQVLDSILNTALAVDVGAPVGNNLLAYGTFIEPRLTGVWNVTMDLDNGDSLMQPVQGTAGALFFGWVGFGIVEFQISSPSMTFAFGDMWSSFLPIAAGGFGRSFVLGDGAL